MTGSTGMHTVRNPGKFEAPGALKMGLYVLMGLGAAATAGGFLSDAHRAWSAFIQNHFYFLSLALGGVFFVAVQWLTGAMWSAPMRRLAESFSAYLPVVLVSTVVLFLGIHHVYHWSHAEMVQSDPVLQGKSGYLNIGFFVIRNLVVVVLWIWFARKFVRNSLAQDVDSSYSWTRKSARLAPGFLILFALTYTMASFDQIMSLDPHWFSTMFGIYCFSGLFYSTLAAICLLAVYLKRKGQLDGIVNENHLHDLGKFMFAFTIFWAYIAFSQFMLIWYANLPEETGYFLLRMKGGWYAVSVFLLVGKFIVPFFALLPRDAKRQERRLVIVAIWMLFAQWVDLLWLIQPEFFAEGPRVGWIEVGMTAGFLGVFGWTVFRFLGRNNVVAVGDPRLPEALHHHQ